MNGHEADGVSSRVWEESQTLKYCDKEGHIHGPVCVVTMELEEEGSSNLSWGSEAFVRPEELTGAKGDMWMDRGERPVKKETQQTKTLRDTASWHREGHQTAAEWIHPWGGSRTDLPRSWGRFRCVALFRILGWVMLTQVHSYQNSSNCALKYGDLIAGKLDFNKAAF
jgi:hypothetical protein